MAEAVRILVVGAHPDDCEFAAGGLAALAVAAGHVVKFVSMTNGDTGHYRMSGAELARRRYGEAQASAKVLGLEYEILDNHNGELEAHLEHRKTLIRIVRRFRPDLVLSHAPDDYHPDHRYTSILVQDSAFQVTVPAMCPLTPGLDRNPIYGYVQGTVTKSRSFTPAVVLDIGPVFDRKIAMLSCHRSQFTEWSPWRDGQLDQLPRDEPGLRQWLANRFTQWMAPLADACREQLVRRYGRRGRKVRFCEAIQPCPFGSPLDEAAIARLFPFLPKAGKGKLRAK